MTDTQKDETVSASNLQDEQIPVIPAKKQSVAGATVLGGINTATGTGVLAGFLNVLAQGSDKRNFPGGETFLKRTFAKMPKTFEFHSKSFQKYVGIGLGLGFAVGVISSAIGAIHHNRELAKAVSTPAPDEQTR